MRTRKNVVLALALCSGLAATGVDASPDAARKFKAEGDGLVQRGKPREATAAYESAVREDPEWLVAYDALAASLFAAAKFNQVIERLKPIVDKRADYATGLYSLGFAYRKTGKLAESIDAYQKYLKLRPTDAEAYYGLGKAQLALDKKNDAIVSFGKYVKLEKRESEKRWVEKAKGEIVALKKAGAKPPADEDKEAPSERTPASRAAAMADQADAQAKMGKWAVAFDLYMKAREQDLSSTRIYDGVGSSGVRAKKHKDMVTLFRNATADNPNYHAGYYYLGLCLAESGKKPEGQDAMKRFVALQDKNPDGQFHLGMMQKDAGKKDESVKSLQKYLQVENRPGAEFDDMKKKAEAVLKDLGAAPAPASPAKAPASPAKAPAAPAAPTK